MKGRAFSETLKNGRPLRSLRNAALREPFAGIGKPKPLRFHLQGCWSRRIGQEHRLVYLARDDRVDFLQARYRY